MQVSVAVSELDTTVTLWHTSCGLWLLSLNMLVRFISAAQHCGSLVTVAAVLEFRTLLALVYLLLLVDVWADPGRGTGGRGCHQLPSPGAQCSPD